MKFFIFLCVLTICNSQIIRSVSMGNTGAFMKDVSNVTLFSGTLLDYTNTVTLELSQAKNYDSYRFFSQLKLSDNNSLSVFLNQPVETEHTGLNRVSSALILKKSTNIYYSTRKGNSAVSFGLMFAKDGEELQEENNKTISTSASIHDIGIRFGLSNKIIDLDVQFHILNSEKLFEDTDFPDSKTDDIAKGSRLKLAGRYWGEVSEKVKFALVSSFSYQATKFNQKHISNFKEIKDSNIEFSVGASINMEYNENNFVVAALELVSYSKLESEFDVLENQMTQTEYNQKQYKKDVFFPSFYLGVESKISSWFTVRLGVNQNYETLTFGNEISGSEFSDTKVSQSKIFNNFNAVFGLGLEKDYFALDFVINEGLLLNGANILSGSTEVFSSMLAATYRF